MIVVEGVYSNSGEVAPLRWVLLRAAAPAP